MQIPGYEWDPQRRRYFKVLKTGELPGSQYTVSALAASKRADRRRKNESQPSGTPEGRSAFEAKQLLHARKSSQVYNGQSEELITSFCYIEGTQTLVTGARNGTVSVNGFRNPCTRSIVQVSAFFSKPMVSAVDEEGSAITVGGSASFYFPNMQISSQTALESAVVVGTQRGCAVWDPNSTELTKPASYKTGSVSSLDKLNSSCVAVGTKTGRTKLFDLRECKVNHNIGSFSTEENSVCVTNVLCAGNYIVATGLQDKMELYDIRRPYETVLEYKGYHNWSSPRHGASLNRLKTAVCVALENGKLSFWDVKTGAQIGGRGRSAFGAMPAVQWCGRGLLVAHANSVRAVGPPPAISNQTEEANSVSLNLTMCLSNARV